MAQHAEPPKSYIEFALPAHVAPWAQPVETGGKVVLMVASSESPSAVTISTNTEEAFQRLVTDWRDRTAHLSLFNGKYTDMAYFQLVGMGKEILPLVFQELEETTSDWFVLLAAVAREDAPVIPAEDNGRARRIANIWMEWGRERGYTT
jgi:hypothetical protein